jgi:hypothetical protein
MMTITGDDKATIPMDRDAADIHPAWSVRLAWEMSEGVVHPRFTYEKRDGESAAVDYAVRMLNHNMGGTDLRLVEAAVLWPSGRWVIVQ